MQYCIASKLHVYFGSPLPKTCRCKYIDPDFNLMYSHIDMGVRQK